MKPELIVFDLDGTLVESAPDLAFAIDAMLERIGRPPAGYANVRSWIGNGVEMIVKRALTGEMWPESEPELYSSAFPLFMQIYGENVCGRSTLFPGVLEGLAGLRALSYPMACLTNKHSQFTKPLLAELGVLSWLDFVGCGDEFPKHKPDPTSLLYTAERFGVDPGACLLIGDSSNDVLAARNSGCQIWCVPYGYHNLDSVDELNPDRVIDSIAELPELLGNCPKPYESKGLLTVAAAEPA